MYEIWKDIEGYEGLYQISSLGRVKSLERTYTANYQGQPIQKKCGERIRKTTTVHGYPHVRLYKHCKGMNFKIHRLIAIAFIPNPDPTKYTNINHKDGNKLNNSIDNLEWSNDQLNIRHGYETGLYDNVFKPVERYTLDGVFLGRWKSAREASKETGEHFGNISDCCRGTRKKCNGYTWKYAERVGI